jgi:hypothetical protein
MPLSIWSRNSGAKVAVEIGIGCVSTATAGQKWTFLAKEFSTLGGGESGSLKLEA